jgi:hypothetical protein
LLAAVPCVVVLLLLLLLLLCRLQYQVGTAEPSHG